VTRRSSLLLKSLPATGEIVAVKGWGASVLKSIVNPGAAVYTVGWSHRCIARKWQLHVGKNYLVCWSALAGATKCLKDRNYMLASLAPRKYVHTKLFTFMGPEMWDCSPKTVRI